MFNFKQAFTNRYGSDFELASKELGKSVRTLKRYYQLDKCEPTVEILLELLNNQYVHPAWEDCYWRPDGHLNTPYGVTRYSDILLVHRYKWHSENASNQIKKLKSSQTEFDDYLEELQEHLLLALGKLASRKLG